MEWDWSEQSPHIHTLYAPWQPNDGYEENRIVAAEERLDIRLPASLRIFYQAWGRRKDLTQTNQYLLGPDELIGRPDALIFCAENQGNSYWAIQRRDLDKANPPVVVASALSDWEMSEISSPLIWLPSPPHIADFLDTLTYHHALCGGALHGGYTGSFHHQEYQNVWVEQHWQRTTVGPMVFGLVDTYSGELPFYIRKGQALAWLNGCSVAVGKAEDLDEIEQALQITWRYRW